MKKTIQISGMHCKSCEVLIQDALTDIGVTAKVNSSKGTAELEYEESNVNMKLIEKIIEQEGFKLK